MDKKIIHTVFERQCTLSPDAIAVEEEEARISYIALNRYANFVATFLLQKIKRPGENVVVIVPPGIPLIASMLGIFKSGNVYVPVDINFPQDKFNRMIRMCVPATVITLHSLSTKVMERLRGSGISVKTIFSLIDNDTVEVINVNSEEIITQIILSEHFSLTNPSFHPLPGDSNYIFFTSGSAGQPKAILGAHQSLSHFIHWEIETFALKAECRASQLIQFTFDASLRDILVPLCTGGTLCIPAKETTEDLQRLLNWIGDRNITLIHTVPSLFRLLTKELREHRSPERFPSLKFILLSGEQLYSKDVQEWRKYVGDKVELVNLYGPTETTMIKTCHRIKDVPENPGQGIHVGKPISNTLIAILNNGAPCNIGEVGEVFIKTPFMSKGYYQQPELTAQVFVKNPLDETKNEIIYRTGDLGRFLMDHSIEILGRMDEQVKIHGVRVELGEVKRAILNVEGVTEVELIVRQDKDFTNELICYFIGRDVDREFIRSKAKEMLVEAMVPAYFVAVDKFPSNANGKVDRKALAKYHHLQEDGALAQPPVGPTEEVLAEIWKEVLGVRQVDRLTSFFHIGGSSLRAIQVIARVYKNFGVRLIIGDIFANPTIEKLTGVIQIAKKRSAFPDLKPVAPGSYYPLSHAQKRLWIQDQYKQHQIAYNINASYKLYGSLSVDAFRQAFTMLVSRHESLRTVFSKVDGDPVQQILSSGQSGFDIDYIDLSVKADKAHRLELLQEHVFHIAYDLASGPLLTVKLVKYQNDEHIFLLSIHHIIADGWSMNVMVDDVIIFYNSLLDARSAALPSLPVQYKDYTVWHNNLLSDAAMTAHAAYWKGIFSDYGNTPALPTDFTRGTIQQFVGDRMYCTIDGDLPRHIKAFSNEKKVTSFHIMLAAIKILLYVTFNKRDIVIGLPFAARIVKELENQIGLYVNMLPFRMPITTDQTLNKVIHTVSASAIQVYEHEIYPFDRIVEDLDLPTTTHRSSLFDVVVQLQDTQGTRHVTDDLRGIRLEEMKGKFMTSKFDLTFDFYETEDSIEVEIEYATDLFREETIRSLIRNLPGVFESMMLDGEGTLDEYRKKYSADKALDSVQTEQYINSELNESF